MCRRSGASDWWQLTHGHPLALWLLVEVLAQRGERGDGPALELGAVPDVVRALL